MSLYVTDLHFKVDQAQGTVIDIHVPPCFLFLPQDQRERRVTVDEVPSGVYLYPEEEGGPDNQFSPGPGPVPGRPSPALFEEALKELLKLMRIEVSTNYCLVTLVHGQ